MSAYREYPDTFDEIVDQPKKARPRFTLFRDLEENSIKSWLVDGFLGDGEASVMYGKPGDGRRT